MSENFDLPTTDGMTEPPMKEARPVAAPISLDAETHALIAKDNSELVRMIRTFMKGQAFPKTLDTEEKIIAAWQVAASLEIAPMVAMSNIAIIHGSICIWGQLPKALADRTGEMEDYEIFLIDAEQKKICVDNANLNKEPWAGVCRIKRRGRTKNEYVFSTDDAKRAGLLDKVGPWKQYKPIMMLRRANAFGIKMEFPDALMGVKIAEYDLDHAPDLKDVGPKKLSIAEKLRLENESKTDPIHEPEESGGDQKIAVPSL